MMTTHAEVRVRLLLLQSLVLLLGAGTLANGEQIPLIVWEDDCDTYAISNGIYQRGPYTSSYTGTTLSQCRVLCTARADCGGFVSWYGNNWCFLFNINDYIVEKYLSPNWYASAKNGWAWYSKTCTYDLGDSDLSCETYQNDHKYQNMYPVDKWMITHTYWRMPNLTPNECQKWCTLYTGCRSVTYRRYKPDAHGYCYLYKTTIQHLLDNGLTSDVVQYTGTDSTYITNDRYCADGTPYVPVLKNSCDDDICRNGGSCTIGWDGLPTCHCLPYYKGDKCEIVKECPKNSEENNSGTCECVAGYEPADSHGIFCTPCAMNFSKKTLGNTKCSECPTTEYTVGIGSASCVKLSNPVHPCTASGMSLVLSNSCDDDICRNGGSCTIGWDGLPTCHCLPYYKGDKCETIQKCPKNSEENNSGTCECVAGYEPADSHGIFCTPCAMNFSKKTLGNTKCSECPTTEYTVGIGSASCVKLSNPVHPCTASGMSLGATLGIVGAIVAVNALCLLIICKKMKTRRQGEMLQWDESHVLRPAPAQYQPVQVAKIIQSDTSS